MYYIKLLVLTSASQIFDLELFIRLMWAYVARLITCTCLWHPVENFSQNETRHFIENMRDFFFGLERWPRRLVTMVKPFLQTFTSPLGIMLATILCSFLTFHSWEGFHLRFTLIFSWLFPDDFYFWVTKFHSVRRWSREPRSFMTIWDNVALHWIIAKGDDKVSLAGTRWRDW
jgi:hypothetical protein